MQRYWLSVVLAALLVTALVLSVSGQEKTPLASLQPLLVDVQQSVPVSFTLSVPVNTTGTQTVTVPAMVDVAIQVRLDTALTATVEVEQAGPALVTVSDLLDSAGLLYELEPVDGVEVIQVRSEADHRDRFALLGEIRNTGTTTLSSLTLHVSLYDPDGVLVDVLYGSARLTTIRPGGTSPFSVSSQVSFDDVARYLVQMEARFER
jgi:hypothetical protein